VYSDKTGTAQAPSPCNQQSPAQSRRAPAAARPAGRTRGRRPTALAVGGARLLGRHRQPRPDGGPGAGHPQCRRAAAGGLGV
jgi:hypothetical protein